METIPFGASGRSTTRLGFGCSSILGALGRRDSLKMLEAAWDAGIRHFDVAPMYGYGEAEACLGDFLSRHRGQATVTSKFGILPPATRASARLARALLRPLVQRFPTVKQLVRRPSAARAPATASPPAPRSEETARTSNPLFTAAEARKSLHRSLDALHCERIDLWLMHDVRPADLIDDGLLRFLEDAVHDGLIGTFGAGTDRSQIDDLLRFHPAYCPALQYEWSVFDPVPVTTGVFRIHHRSLAANFSALHAAMLADPQRCARWSQAVEADLTNPKVVANLMLKAALILNPQSVILFSSKSPRHMAANVQLACDSSLDHASTVLYGLVQRELHAH